MTFIPQKNEKYCFISCSEDKIKLGQCSCVNNKQRKYSFMKTLELKLKKDVLIVDAENGFNHFKIYDDEIGFIFIENCIPRKELLKGSYKFLCKGSELTEEIASELVDKSIHTGLYAYYVDNIPVNASFAEL